ncbi:ABC transporter permease [Chungangia koreensis]|uniref:ABC transporter permease n=1 Tax=Chungangia koreensis TaxID=752657 RepID=A0ABV8X4D0_9LACT
MRVLALGKRILRQIIRDKRTLGLLIMAPILVLTMLYLVFEGEDYIPKVGLVDVPTGKMELNGAEITNYDSEKDAANDLVNRDIDAYIALESQTPKIVLEGSDPAVSGTVMKWFQSTLPVAHINDALKPEIEYLHGSEDMGSFDYFGPVLLGFFVFFFVFLIAGVSFLRERTKGTLERLMASPIRKWEIVLGYILGFGLFTMIQATVIAAYAVYVLDMLMEGSFFSLLIIILLLSLTALTLGTLLSSFANNELQMIQFIPLVVVPQIFFSGLFNLETISEWISWIGPFTPLYYAADALRDVMVRGYGFNEIQLNLLVLFGFSLLFFFLNTLVLRKYRKI